MPIESVPQNIYVDTSKCVNEAFALVRQARKACERLENGQPCDREAHNAQRHWIALHGALDSLAMTAPAVIAKAAQKGDIAPEKTCLRQAIEQARHVDTVVGHYLQKQAAVANDPEKGNIPKLFEKYFGIVAQPIRDETDFDKEKLLERLSQERQIFEGS